MIKTNVKRPPGQKIGRRAAVVVGCCACWLFSGCGKPESHSGATTPPSNLSPETAAQVAAPDPVDMTQLRKAFESADPAFQVYLAEAVAVVQTRAYADAIEQFQKLDRNPKLTDPQRQAVQDMIAKLQPLAANQRR